MTAPIDIPLKANLIRQIKRATGMSKRVTAKIK